MPVLPTAHEDHLRLGYRSGACLDCYPHPLPCPDLGGLPPLTSSRLPAERALGIPPVLARALPVAERLL